VIRTRVKQLFSGFGDGSCDIHRTKNHTCTEAHRRLV
jgi:hypothetical protein